MASTKGSDQSPWIVPRAEVSRPSPADRFNIDRDGQAKRAWQFRALEQQFQKLNEYCDETVAEIRASLDRTLPRQISSPAAR
jgi:hypothetical protein